MLDLAFGLFYGCVVLCYLCFDLPCGFPVIVDAVVYFAVCVRLDCLVGLFCWLFMGFGFCFYC